MLNCLELKGLATTPMTEQLGYTTFADLPDFPTVGLNSLPSSL